MSSSPCSDHKVQARFCHFSKLFLSTYASFSTFLVNSRKNNSRIWPLINLGVAESFNTMWSPTISLFFLDIHKLANLHFPGRLHLVWWYIVISTYPLCLYLLTGWNRWLRRWFQGPRGFRGPRIWQNIVGGAWFLGHQGWKKPSWMRHLIMNACVGFFRVRNQTLKLQDVWYKS